MGEELNDEEDSSERTSQRRGALGSASVVLRK